MKQKVAAAFDVLYAENERLQARVEELEGALQATSKELAHWLAFANRTAVSPQREKTVDALTIALAALTGVSFKGGEG